MGQCIITRRGGGVETEPYNFYTDTTTHSLFSVNVNTSGVTSLSSGTLTISIPNYEATSVTFTVRRAITGAGACYLQGGVESATLTLKPGQSVSKTFYLKQVPASSDILAYIYVTFIFNGTAIVSTATASGTGIVPTSNVRGFANLDSVKAYFNKVK